MRIAALLFAAAVFSSALVAAQTTPVVPLSIPTAIYTDPPADKAHPAAMDVLHIPTHGLLINGLIYQPAGAGPHPTLVICHGLPGNEKNLDLAQAVRRAGWNAVTFNYRGSWGSPGSFRFAQNIEDANAVLVYLRDPANATRLGVDPKRIAIAGHSMGGWVTAHVAAHDPALIGAILISAADMGALAENQPKAGVVAEMNGDMESLAGATAESMADEVIAHAKEYRFSGNVDGLGQIPLLVLSADDGLAPETDALVKGLTGNGSRKVTAIHVATDHSWSDHRIFLESTIITWLAALNQGQPR
jgi:pimeloyl-ACP methyl ester carboxylesterase